MMSQVSWEEGYLKSLAIVKQSCSECGFFGLCGWYFVVGASAL